MIYVLYLGEGGGGRVLGIVVIYVLYLGEGGGGRVLGRIDGGDPEENGCTLPCQKS